MKEPRDEFLEHIKSTLLGHEEPYDEGAWERFAAKNISTGNKPKPVIAIWKWAAAAAAVLIGAVLMLQYFNAPNTVNMNNDRGSVVTTEDNKQQLKNIQPGPADTSNAIAITPDNNVTNPDKTNHNDNYTQPKQFSPPPFAAQILNQQPIAAQEDNTQTAPARDAIVQQQPVQIRPQEQPAQNQPEKPFWQSGVEREVATKPAPQNNNNVVAVHQPSKQNEKQGKAGKWLSSLYVSPNFSNEGINMGYGYSLGYAVNDKIKISSGIAYTKVSASRNFDAPEPANALAMDATIGVNSYSRSVAASNFSAGPSAPYLQSMESWVSGIDVPVEVTYNVNKNVYASGGVSGLFVVNGEDRKKMVSDLNSRAPVLSSEGNVKGYSSLADESKPQYETSRNDNTSFMGFYNISMGYKQKVSDKNSISLEPFIKIPMKQATEQKLNFTGVGVRLKFDF